MSGQHTARVRIWACMAALAIGGLAGCNREAEAPPAAGASSPGQIAVLLAPSGKGDVSYNDAALSGLHGRLAREILPGRPDDYPGVIRQLVEAKTGLIIGVGFLYGDAFKNAAPLHPQTKFLLLDAEVAGVANVRSVVFKPDEGSFLAGVAAASMSKTGKVGFIGGMDIPIIRAFACGFENGARAVAARRGQPVTVLKAYVGNTPDAFSNPAKGAELARAMYGGSADIIYHAAGASGLGVIQTAKEQRRWVVGVDVDQSALAPDNVITSMRKRLDLAVEDAVKHFDAGSWTGGTITMTLQNNGVDLVMPGMLDAAAQANVKAFQAEVVQGKATSCPDKTR